MSILTVEAYGSSKVSYLVTTNIKTINISVTKTGSCLEFDPTEAVKKYQASVENTLTKGLQSTACKTLINF